MLFEVNSHLLTSCVCVCVCRGLLCNLVRVKLSCYELEAQCSLSVEDYLKAFMENEVKPLWPKGWMQARLVDSCVCVCVFVSVSPRMFWNSLTFGCQVDVRVSPLQYRLCNAVVHLVRMLFKESRAVHSHLTGNL